MAKIFGGLFGALDARGRVMMTALVVSCGAEADEVDQVIEELRALPVPETHGAIARQVRDVIAGVRG